MEEDVEVGWQDSSGSFPGLAAQNTQLEGMTYAQAGSHWEEATCIHRNKVKKKG